MSMRFRQEDILVDFFKSIRFHYIALIWQKLIMQERKQLQVSTETLLKLS